ncbi:MAG: DpnD/PcfM family protein [Lachnospiraceae bacterium]|nr:DpnD/PcfM family protein [Lachnospiraceae bacterium]
MRYEIEVKEELSRIVRVKADNLADAIGKVEEMYKSCAIVLDEDDFKGVSIEPYDNLKLTKIR